MSERRIRCTLLVYFINFILTFQCKKGVRIKLVGMHLDMVTKGGIWWRTLKEDVIMYANKGITEVKLTSEGCPASKYEIFQISQSMTWTLYYLAHWVVGPDLGNMGNWPGRLLLRGCKAWHGCHMDHYWLLCRTYSSHIIQHIGAGQSYRQPPRIPLLRGYASQFHFASDRGRQQWCSPRVPRWLGLELQDMQPRCQNNRLINSRKT